jgi:hypothetical protein
MLRMLNTGRFLVDLELRKVDSKLSKLEFAPRMVGSGLR